jgi:hypothetical protein
MRVRRLGIPTVRCLVSAIVLTCCSEDRGRMPPPSPDRCAMCRAECVELNDFRSVFWCTQCCDWVCSESESSAPESGALYRPAFDEFGVCVEAQSSTPPRGDFPAP